MSCFCLLADPETYVAHDWDLSVDEVGRRHWLDLFDTHFTDTLTHAVQRYGRSAEGRIAAARKQFSEVIEKLRADPAAPSDRSLNVIELCRLREKALRDHGLADPFAHIKERENNSAAMLYEPVVRKLRSMQGRTMWLHLIRSLFAGNIFDLGSPATMHLADESPDFLALIENIKARPWLVDDFDRLDSDLSDSPPTKWSKAIVFVDNAGSDLILGVMPLVRTLALYGTKVVLAANELPSLNDITAYETVDIIQRLAVNDLDLAALVEAGMFEIISTGNDIPLIDLSEVSDELNEAAADADLVVMEGMGRAVESNFDAAFTVDSLKLALLKDPIVAGRIGGQVYDCVCKYSPAGQ